MQLNKLTLNLMKTHYIGFHRAKHKTMDSILCVNNVSIHHAFSKQFLGIIIYNDLNHISYINSKTAKGICIMCRARNIHFKLDKTILVVY